MSELKRHHINEVMDMHNLTRGEMGYSFVYYADDVDRVIAELEENHKKEVEQLLMEIVELKADYKEACDRLQTANLIKDEQIAATRHQKYKRCLAMYRYCLIKALYELDFKGNDVEWKWYSKWMHNWFRLAEHFKEAK